MTHDAEQPPRAAAETEPKPNPAEAHAMFESLYGELRSLARSLFVHQPAGHTLQPTALVHEAYLKVARSASASTIRSREHALALGAKAMRQLLINHANASRAQKRGGGKKRLTLTGLADAAQADQIDAIALHDALAELERLDERQCRVVECRYFAGLTVEETARVLGVSSRTVELDTRMARLWLMAKLNGETMTDSTGEASGPAGDEAPER